MAGQSLLTVAGWWVAWVYALSLALPLVLGSVRNDSGLTREQIFERWASSVVFEKPLLVVSQADASALGTLKALASTPAPIAGNVEVMVNEVNGGATQGVDFEVASRGAEIHFEAGATEGTLRILPDWGPDIRIVDHKTWKEPRSFRLGLKAGGHLLPAGDLAMCTVTIKDEPEQPDPGRIDVGFAKQDLLLSLKDLATTPIEITAATAVEEPVPVFLNLYRSIDGYRQSLGRFERTFDRGMRKMVFRLSDVIEPDELEKLGLVDSGAPGRDETLELDLMASPPLFATQPRTCKIVAENTNRPPETRLVYLDKDGREISYLDWNGGSVALAYDRAMANASDHAVTIDGEQVGVATFPAGSTRSNPISLAGAGLEGRVGRKCGVGTKPGSGCCKGQGGCSAKALCGAPVPGDYMLIVVNNERLHDPNDGIVAEVRKALADESAKPYGNGAIILNPQGEGEDELTPTSGGPDPKKMFQPFSEQGHDVASQLQRIEEVVALKREAAANEDLRAVVVWSERDLAAGTGVRPVAGPGLQPMSFLLPDAAPSYARSIERGLVPPTADPRDVTVRAPREDELQAHLINVIAEGRSAEGGSAE